MRIYILNYSTGFSGDFKHTWIKGTYDSKELAMEEKEKLIQALNPDNLNITREEVEQVDDLLNSDLILSEYLKDLPLGHKSDSKRAIVKKYLPNIDYSAYKDYKELEASEAHSPEVIELEVKSSSTKRKSGRTTRLCDYYIQHLFNTGSTGKIIDHYPSNKADLMLANRIMDRLNFEFKNTKYTFDKQKVIITLIK